MIGRDLLARSALEMMDAAVTLEYLLICKSALLKVAIYVGSHHK